MYVIMNIVIIGSGNVAAVLGRKFVKASHHILQVLSRNAAAASELAYEWDTESANYLSLINKEADVYIIAVSDDAISAIIKDLRLPGKIVAHTAASVKMDVLAKVTENYGVFYPLQSMKKEQPDSPDIPIYTEAVNDSTNVVLEKLARSISENSVKTADYDKRTRLHVAAVIVNNFTNHIFSLAEEYCKSERLDFKDLLPLIHNTIERVHTSSPAAMQTGPAIRNDQAIIEKHLELLQRHPKLLRLYECMTGSIMNK